MPSKQSRKKNNKKTITIEKRYKQKTQHQHILDLPDTYVGSTKVEDKHKMWVYDDQKECIVYKIISYVPALYKIFDEIIVNARDHTIKDKTCRVIKVNIDQKTGEISCYNDGNGKDSIPVAIHKDNGMWVPEMIFGHLLTSGNYDQIGKTTGGKNGFGAKLANIYSKKFYIEVVDSSRGKKFTQLFTNNMYDKEKPKIKDTKKKQSYVLIKFTPDFKRFGIKGLTDDIVALFKKRVYDIAACTRRKIKVYLNDEYLNIKSFDKYIKMYYEKGKLPSKLIYEDVSKRWKVGVIYDQHSGFRHISYVNGICTFQGGKHVEHVLDQILTQLMKHIQKKYKKVLVKRSYIKDNITIFINAVIEDPSFNSQIKECLTNKVADFGSRCDISDEFIKSIINDTGLIKEAVEFAKLKNLAGLKKSDGKKGSIKGMDKLDDAEWAGGRKSNLCRLILTEGDSAKSYAISGLEIIGYKKYGVFPLKGKLLNVREATASQLVNNEEIKNIKKIMGLKQNMVYNDVSKLRYGGIVVLTDQDVDGYHIKGLIMNFIQYFWPSLANIPGFIQSISTPIVKAWKNTDKKKKKPKIFYTETAYEQWKKSLGDNIKKWNSKYYKGLGTSTPEEAMELFQDFEDRLIDYYWSNNGAANNPTSKKDISYKDSKCYDAMNLAFSGKEADKRKIWLGEYNRENIIENSERNVSYHDFVHKELIHFSYYNNERSIPSICDGLKPSQRKIIYVAFYKKIFKKEIKVSQFSASVAEISSYHHGEKSLQDAIVNMAQNFIGSNNINLLVPKGAFGTRRQGGKNSASPRYINTMLNELTPLIFNKDDEYVYKYVNDDGHMVEPITYAPIIPMVLVNGTHGIGTGWSTHVPCYNPLDIINNIRRMINNKEPEEYYPWYYGFTGKIIKLNNTTYRSIGKYKIMSRDTIKISEIPIGVWTEDYFSFLNTLREDNKKYTKNKIIRDWTHKCSNKKININITLCDSSIIKKLRKAKVQEESKRL